MGMFGGLGRALSKPASGDGLSLLDRIAIFGTAASGDFGTAMKLRQMSAQRQKQADQQSFLGGLQGLMQPGYAEQEAPQVSLDPAQGTAAGYQYQPPARTRDPLSINSPELPGLALKAQQLGVPISALLDVLKAQQPDMAVGPDGTTYNKHSSNLPTRFRSPQAVNNTIVDMGAPENENRVIPSEPVKGAMPVYDNRGRVVDWSLPQGARGAIAGAAGAESAGRSAGSAPYEFVNVPGPDGQPTVMSRSRAAGGVFSGQTPGDAAYDADLAKASAGQYTGIQAAGQAASGKIATVRQIDNLLTGLSTGKFTPAMADIQSAASSLGIKIDPKWGRVQAADALSNALTLQASGGSLGSGFSNADRDFQKSISPSAMQTPEGRRRVVAFTVAKAQREQQVAKMARQWQQGAGRLDKPDRNGKTFFDYLDAYAEANPLVPK